MGEMEAGVKTFSRIFSLSLNAKKIAIQILGILCAVIVWHVLQWLGGHLLRLQWLVDIIDWIVTIFILFFTWGAIARITVSEVGELPPVDITGALRSAKKAMGALVTSPLKIVLIILILMLLHVIVSWIGMIPYLGEIIWPFCAIPLFLLSALIVVAKIILACGALLLPTIIMVGKQSPVSELNDFLRENILRFIGYLIATIVVVAIIFLFLDRVAVTNESLSSSVMGQKYATIVSSVPTALNAAIQRVSPALKIFSSGYSQETLYGLKAILQGAPSSAAPVSGVRWTFSFAGFIWGIFTLLIYLAILSLPFVIWCVSGTLIYLGLKPEAIPKPQE